MTDSLIVSAWSPGLIGFTISIVMYGVTVGQSIYYACCFPNDTGWLKLLVLSMFLADTLHLIGGVQIYWIELISCHRQYSAVCKDGLPWGLVLLITLDVLITFVVQCFYGHRIWIISGRNRVVTGALFAVAILGAGSGIGLLTGFRFHSMHSIAESPWTVPMAVMNIIGDFITTGTVFKYMWRTGFRKKRSAIRDLAVIFINMGAFTCLISTCLGITSVVQGNHDLVAAIGVVTSRSYVNSMLAVLNARQIIRGRTATISFELSDVVYSFQ